jgi:hypothetical protein
MLWCVALLPGCALINAATGGGDDDDGGPCAFDDPSCVDQCQNANFLGEAPFTSFFTTCDAIVRLDFDACGVGQFGAAVATFSVPTPGEYRVCTTTPNGDDIFVTDQCTTSPGDYTCIAGDGACTQVFLSGGGFLYWQGAEQIGCTTFDVQIEPVVEPMGEICLDGFDNDQNGLTDCEDPACWNDVSGCSLSLGGEGQCDNQDEANSPAFPPNTIDELACACASNQGCDQIGGAGNAQGWVCQLGIGSDGANVCAPPCDKVDWCGLVGMVCAPGGMCMPGAPSPVSVP